MTTKKKQNDFKSMSLPIGTYFLSKIKFINNICYIADIKSCIMNSCANCTVGICKVLIIMHKKKFFFQKIFFWVNFFQTNLMIFGTHTCNLGKKNVKSS